MKRKYVGMTQKEWLAHEGVAKLGKGRISKVGHLYLNEVHSFQVTWSVNGAGGGVN